MQSKTMAGQILPGLAKVSACLCLLAAPLIAGERLVLEVREVGGFRRHEPVSSLLTFPKAISRGTTFRLLIKGAPTAAQFRPATDAEQAAQWWIDFSTILSPYERQECVIEYGSGVQALPESVKGHVLRQTRDTFVIENAPYIFWTVPRDLKGLLRSVNFPPNEHLRPQSPGLLLRDKAGGRHPLGGDRVKARVVRSGTRAVALQFSGNFDQGALAGVRWTVDLIFPSPVSWMEVLVTVDDPTGKVAGVGAELNMALDPPKPEAPTLVDVGAWTYLYTSLMRNEIVELQAAPGNAKTVADPLDKNSSGVQGTGGRCKVLSGPPDQLIPLATNFAAPRDLTPARPLSAAPEGWLHVMDRKRCLALAVDQFAQNAGERLTASADGHVSVWRDFSTLATSDSARHKSLRIWLHFVHYPPQYSAGTSPRMMQTRPTVRTWDR